jgi:hypothetical protein
MLIKLDVRWLKDIRFLVQVFLSISSDLKFNDKKCKLFMKEKGKIADVMEKLVFHMTSLFCFVAETFENIREIPITYQRVRWGG